MDRNTQTETTEQHLGGDWDERIGYGWEECDQRVDELQLVEIVQPNSVPFTLDVGDRIYVPSFDEDQIYPIGNRIGGIATISRIIKGLNDDVYLSFKEHGNYHDVKWTGYLDNIQSDLEMHFGKQPAHLKQK